MSPLPVVVFLILLALAFPAPASAAEGVQLGDGNGFVEADPQAPTPIVDDESPNIPFSGSVSSGSSVATQTTTAVDSRDGILFESSMHVAGASSDFAYSELTRSFTVTQPGLRMVLTGSIAGSGDENRGAVTFNRTDVPGDVVSVDMDDDQPFSESATLAPGTYAISVDLACEPGPGQTCTADLQLRLELGVPEPPCATEVQVGFARAQGCFSERSPGVFQTADRAWVGGFEIVPRPGGRLVLNTGVPSVAEEGAGADVIFAGFAVPVPIALLPVGVQDGTVELNVAGTAEKILLDLPFEAGLKVGWTDGGASASIEGDLKLAEMMSDADLATGSPSVGLGEVSGKLKGKLRNGAGFLTEEAQVSVASVTFVPRFLRVRRAVSLRDILLRFELRDGRPFWTGQAGIRLPLARGDLDVVGRVFVFETDFAGGGLSANGLNRRIWGPVVLQRIGGDFVFKPRYGGGFALGASLGPRIRGKEILSVDGVAQAGALVSGCANGLDPVKLETTAKLTPLAPLEAEGAASVEIQSRYCTYVGSGIVEGTLQSKIGFAGDVLGAESTLTGFVTRRAASFEGNGIVRIPFAPDLNGSVIVSTVGLAACANNVFFHGGFAYRWGQEGLPRTFLGCDLGPFRAVASSRARTAARVRVPRGLPHVAFAARAASGAPRVRVAGPGGVRLVSPANGALRSRRALTVPVAHERTTYVVVNDPRPGVWRVETAEPGVSLSRVTLAEGLPKPRARARVTGRGAKRRLRWSLRKLPGQRVRLFERGPGVSRLLGVARRRRGALRFRPTRAPRRARRIEAEVSQNGLPRAVLTVARFRAPRLVRPGRPKVRAARRGTTLTLRWRAVRGAAQYVVEVRSGSALLNRLVTRRRRVRFPDMPRSGALRVGVQALGRVTAPGPVARLTVRR